MTKKKVVFIVNHAAFFVSHRLMLAKQIIRKGWDFHLIIGSSASKKMENNSIKILKKNNISYTTTTLKNNFTLNLISELFALIRITFILIKLKPDIVHLVSPKAILFGGVACKLVRIKKLVISISGLGSLVTYKKNFFFKITNFIYFILFKNFVYHKNCKIIFQNYDDKNFIKKKLRLKNNSSFVFIPGSGVNLKEFKQKNFKINNTVLMVSRILVDKGVREYFGAAEIVKKKYPSWKFLLIGPNDYKSHAAIKTNEFKYLLKKKNVIWMDYKENVKKYIKNASIICLPSYREGLSKFLIEAIASNRPIVTTNVPGCRDLVINGRTGIIVKPKSSLSLANGLIKIISNNKKLKKFNYNYKSLNIEMYDIKEVINKTIKIYNEFNKFK